MEKLSEYWIEHNQALWRKARKTHQCDGELYDAKGLERRHEDGSLVRCDREISKGDNYLDTNETVGVFNTLRLCERCANQMTKKL